MFRVRNIAGSDIFPEDGCYEDFLVFQSIARDASMCRDSRVYLNIRHHRFLHIHTNSSFRCYPILRCYKLSRGLQTMLHTLVGISSELFKNDLNTRTGSPSSVTFNKTFLQQTEHFVNVFVAVYERVVAWCRYRCRGIAKLFAAANTQPYWVMRHCTKLRFSRS
jgi:hypothetical protein